MREVEVPGIDPRIARAFDLLRLTWKESREKPPAAVIGRLADRLGIVANAAAGERGGTRSGNLLKTVSIARTSSSEGASLTTIVGNLESILEEESDVAEMDIDPDREDAVRLMNLHQVKGLEAPVVFLIDPSPPWSPDSRFFIDRAGEISRGYFTLLKKFGRSEKVIAQPPGWDSMARMDQQFHSAEMQRLLYVAATRAMSMLVVGSQPGTRGPKGAWAALARSAADRLAIEEEDAAPGAVPATRQLDFEAALQTLRGNFTKAGDETYSVVPVTKIAHGDHREVVKVEEGLGRGMSWGRVLHRLLEAMLRDESLDLEAYAANLLRDEEREPAEIEDVLSTVHVLQKSELWQRVLRAERRMVEVPFAVMAPAKSLGLDQDGETLLHGAIDLAFLENGSWYVIDYKTDSVQGVGRIESLVAYYAPQVREYVRFFSRITGLPARGGLFFVDGPVERWIDE